VPIEALFSQGEENEYVPYFKILPPSFLYNYKYSFKFLVTVQETSLKGKQSWIISAKTNSLKIYNTYKYGMKT
jgi:hypothetical protein